MTVLTLMRRYNQFIVYVVLILVSSSDGCHSSFSRHLFSRRARRERSQSSTSSRYMMVRVPPAAPPLRPSPPPPQRKPPHLPIRTRSPSPPPPPIALSLLEMGFTFNAIKRALAETGKILLVSLHYVKPRICINSSIQT